MGDPAGGSRAGFRIVPPGEPPPAPRSRRPGPAVLLVLVYAALFGGGLWWFRARSPLFRAKTASGAQAAKSSLSDAGAAAPAPPKAAAPSERRRALLAGEGLSGAAAEKYARRLAAERCTCGCDLALNVCLARDASCVRSPEIAERVRDSFR
ncbi:MAG: hypothetical protein ABI914_03275 [Acidobacteriota bacterium]